MDHKVTTDYTRLLGNANVKVCAQRSLSVSHYRYHSVPAWLSLTLTHACEHYADAQVYVRARPCADGQKPPEDMFERNRDTQKNIVIKVRLLCCELIVCGECLVARHCHVLCVVDTVLTRCRTRSACSMATTRSALTT